MPPAGFKPTISAGERPQTYALDCAATGTGTVCYILLYYMVIVLLWSDNSLTVCTISYCNYVHVAEAVEINGGFIVMAAIMMVMMMMMMMMLSV